MSLYYSKTKISFLMNYILSICWACDDNNTDDLSDADNCNIETTFIRELDNIDSH